MCEVTTKVLKKGNPRKAFAVLIYFGFEERKTNIKSGSIGGKGGRMREYKDKAGIHPKMNNQKKFQIMI
jgi:hypothetical protein